VQEVEQEILVELDPTLRSFFSVNTPEALEIATRWRAEERSNGL
jgi:hypothetical protein